MCTDSNGFNRTTSAGKNKDILSCASNPIETKQNIKSRQGRQHQQRTRDYEVDFGDNSRVFSASKATSGVHMGDDVMTMGAIRYRREVVEAKRHLKAAEASKTQRHLKARSMLQHRSPTTRCSTVEQKILLARATD